MASQRSQTRQSEVDERRAFREGSRRLRQKVLENETALGDVDSSAFQEISRELHQNIKKVNEKVHTARDAVADNDAYTEFVKYSSKRADNLRGDACWMSEADLIEGLKKRYSCGSMLRWAAIGHDVENVLPLLPRFHSLSGPLKRKPQARAVRTAPQQKKNDAPVRQPKRLKSSEEDKAQTRQTKRISRQHKVLQAQTGAQGKKPKGVGLFELVMQPKSFAQTVENIFDLSFLVKEGRARLKADMDDGTPQVATAVRPQSDDQDLTCQSVLCFSMDHFAQINEARLIEQGMIPPRAEAEAERGRSAEGDEDDQEEEEEEQESQAESHRRKRIRDGKRRARN